MKESGWWDLNYLSILVPQNPPTWGEDAGFREWKGLLLRLTLCCVTGVKYSASLNSSFLLCDN